VAALRNLWARFEPRIFLTGASEERGTEAPRRVVQCLLQRAIDRAKHGVQVAPQTVDGSEDGNRNAGRDQTIFDRGGTGLVGQEFQKGILQTSLLGLCGQTPQNYGWRI